MGFVDKLSAKQQEFIRTREFDGLAVSAISCWEVGQKVEQGKLSLQLPLDEWFAAATSHPTIRMIDLSPAIALASTRLPGEFHKDPADRMIVATARALDLVLMTADEKILNYPHVKSTDGSK